MYTSIHTSYGGVDYSLPQNISAVYFHPVFQQVQFWSAWVYSYHMPLFFILSGAVLGLRAVGQFDVFIKRKIRRLLVPYFAVGWLFMLPIKYGSGFYTREGFLLAAKGFLLGVDSGHLWFLPALFWCTIIFVLLQKIIQKVGVNSEYILLGAAGMISLTYTSLPFDFFFLKEGMRYLVWFALGYIFEKERKYAKSWSRIELLGVYAIALLLSFIQYRYDILPPFYVTLLGSIRIVLLAYICMMLFPGLFGTKTGKLVSRNLFNIYLFHDPLEYIVLKVFFSSTLLTTGTGCIMYLLIRLFLVGILSILIGECVRSVRNLGKRYLSIL